MTRREICKMVGLMPFAFVQAAVAESAAFPLGKDCPRQDCRFISEGGSSTLLGWSPVYDKSGNRVDGGDPNTYTSNSRCLTCGKRFVTETTRGQSSTFEVPAETSAR